MAVEITLKGRRIPLIYTTYEMKQMQEEIAPLSELNRAIYGRNPKDETDTSGYASAEHLSNVAKLIRILGNAGLEESGQEPDLDEKWILRNMKPAMVAVYAMLVLSVITAGNIMEAKQEQNGPVNEITEEIEAKKQQGN